MIDEELDTLARSLAAGRASLLPSGNGHAPSSAAAVAVHQRPLA